MANKSIIVLYYSNGVDIFGPVHIDEFKKNKYYQSTLIWYDGLEKWIPIGECNELKHLIGTIPSPANENRKLQAQDNIAPPLSNKLIPKAQNKSINKTTLIIAVAILFFLSIYLFNLNSSFQKDLSSDSFTDSMRIDSSETALISATKTAVELKTYRNNWQKFVSVVPNDFNRKEMGGISELKVFLNNNLPYGIDSVKVKIDYIKSNGDVYQSEIIRFDLVLPNSKKELFAPNSNRGVKVNCQILELFSTEMKLCFDKKLKNLNEDDPYLCH